MGSGNIKKFELKLGKAGLIIVIFGMAVLLCASFLFGVGVGKNIDTYPGKIASLPQRILALIWRPAKIKATPNLADNKSGQDQAKAGEDIDLTFYNTLTSKKGVAKEQLISERKAATVEVPAPQPEETQSTNEGKTATVDLDVKAKKQPDLVKEETGKRVDHKSKETIPATVSPGKKYIIQAVSLKEKANANQISKKITALGFKSRIIKVDVKGKGIWYRVIVSGFENKVQAKEASAKISKITGTNCIIKHVDTGTKKN